MSVFSLWRQAVASETFREDLSFNASNNQEKSAELFDRAK
jgi:hypothetical protein